MKYTYGMKLRGFSIGCQPMNGFVERKEDTSGKYHDLLIYDRELTQEELNRYDLDLIESENKMKETKATVIPMIEQLESLFSKLNDKFFEGKLETPVITIAPDTCRAYGWFTTWRAWKETDNEDSEGYYEINVTCDYLNRTPVEIASTLLHEMVHLYCQMNGIKDTSRAGNYHNKNFKTAAEEHGLICEKVPKSGFGCTEPTPKTAEYLESLNLKFDLYRPTPEPEQKVVKRSSSRKYVCPVCGSIIRATKPVRVICYDCGVEYEEVV